jgi:hypothetical protein
MSSKLFFVLEIIFLVAAASITDIVSAAEAIESSVKFSVKEAQQAFINELKRENITFRVDQEGSVWYRIDDQKKVARIQAKIIDDVLVGTNSVSYQNSKDTDLFINKLKLQNIPYSVKEENNRTFVIWRHEDDAKVRKIEQSILDDKVKKMGRRE